MTPTKNPRPAAGGRHGSGASEMFLPEHFEDTATPPFKSIGDMTSRIVARIARRHHLATPTAKVMVELAGLAKAVS